MVRVGFDRGRLAAVDRDAGARDRRIVFVHDAARDIDLFGDLCGREAGQRQGDGQEADHRLASLTVMSVNAPRASRRQKLHTQALEFRSPRVAPPR